MYFVLWTVELSNQGSEYGELWWLTDLDNSWTRQDQATASWDLLGTQYRACLFVDRKVDHY